MNTTHHPRRGWRPLLEALEDRLTPATYTVNAITDTGAGSGLAGDLRYCITRADADPSSAIVFDATVFATAQTITLVSAPLPDLAQDMQITGPAAGVTLMVAGKGRGFTIDSGAAVTIANLTIWGGNAGNHSLGGGILNGGTLTLRNCTFNWNYAPGGSGGGVANNGTLTLFDCTFHANSALYNGRGGGIANSGTATLFDCTLRYNIADGGDMGGSGGGIFNSGALTLFDCTLSGNSAEGGWFHGGGKGGGITNDGTATLVNCTLSGNAAHGSSVYEPYDSNVFGSGGGIVNGGALTLTNCTLSGNSATNGYASYLHPGWSGSVPGSGGGIFNSGTATLTNTIVAGNSASKGAQFHGTGTLAGDYNLTGDGSAPGPHSIKNIDPLLAPLGDYGGPTPTMPLLPGSPALDAGTVTGAPGTDQRGLPRVGAVDLGAFESQGVTLAVLAGANQTTPAGTAFPTALAVLVTANDAVEPVQGGVVTFTAPAAGPSGTFANGQATATVAIDGTRIATAPPLTANGVAGSYAVTAAAGAASAAIPLTNATPFTATERFVDHLYQDLLGRPASPAEVNFFEAVLDQGLMTQAQLATFFLNSFEGRAHQVDQLYLRLLGRPADPATQAAALYLSGGGSPAQLKVIVLGSDEYYRLHGGTDAGFLAGLGRDVLGGSLDPAGLALFQAELSTGTSRYVVALQVLGAPQAAVAEANRLYQEALGRPASASELLLPAMYILGGNETDVILALLLSEEYARLP
jgi:hypothetical protein